MDMSEIYHDISEIYIWIISEKYLDSNLIIIHSPEDFGHTTSFCRPTPRGCNLKAQPFGDNSLANSAIAVRSSNLFHIIYHPFGSFWINHD